MKSYSILSYISNFMIHFSDFSHLKSEDIFTLALSSKEREKSSSFNFSLLAEKWRDIDFAHFFEDETKLQSENTCQEHLQKNTTSELV